MLGFSQHIGQSAVAIVVSPMRLRMQPIHATCGSLQTMHAACGPPLRHEHLVSNAGSMRAILYALIFLHISSASASNLIMEFHHVGIPKIARQASIISMETTHKPTAAPQLSADRLRTAIRKMRPERAGLGSGRPRRGMRHTLGASGRTVPSTPGSCFIRQLALPRNRRPLLSGTDRRAEAGNGQDRPLSQTTCREPAHRGHRMPS